MAKEGIGIAEAQTDKQGKLRAESDLDMLRILVDSIMEYAIIMLDPKGNMVSWTAAAERLKGYSASEVVARISPSSPRPKTRPPARLTSS